MKKLFNLGDGGVDTSSPIKTALENLFSIYDEFQQLLEQSAYVVQDENGRNIRELFPISGKSDAFDLLREKFKEAKRCYVFLQNQEMEKRPDLKAQYFSKHFNKSHMFLFFHNL